MIPQKPIYDGGLLEVAEELKKRLAVEGLSLSRTQSDHLIGILEKADKLMRQYESAIKIFEEEWRRREKLNGQ